MSVCVCVCVCVCVRACVFVCVQQIHHKKATFLGIDSSSDLMENHIGRFSVRLLANIYMEASLTVTLSTPAHLHP